MSGSAADVEQLLLEAERQQKADWLSANLLTAAAVAAVVGEEPIVVGGTAEAYWTGREVYHETDLDLWIAGSLDGARRSALESLGFRRDARHWGRAGLRVILEFPGGEFAGDREKVVHKEVAGARVAVIGLDDLYLDRLTKATANTNEESVEFLSALSVATYRFDEIDWAYITATIKRIRSANSLLGLALQRRNRRIRQLVRQRLSDPDLH